MGDRLVDFLVWGILLLFSVKGFLKGLVREVCSLLGLVVGVWAAFRFSSSLAPLFKPILPLPNAVAIVLAFLLTIVAVGILAWLLGHLLTAVFRLVLLGGINRAGGIVFGLLQGALLLSIVLAWATMPGSPSLIRQKVEAARSSRPFVVCGRELLAGWRERGHARDSAAAR